MAKIKTVQGDTWDIIAKRIYNRETCITALIQANPAFRKYVIFPAGVELEAPEISNRTTAADLPPWRKSGGR